MLAECQWRPNSGCEHSEARVVSFSSSDGDSDSGVPLLVQIYTSTSCRLLLNTGENAELIVMTILKNSGL